MSPFRCLVLAAAFCVSGGAVARAQVVRHPPRVAISPAPRQQLVLSGDPVVDSNSPVIWDLVDGQPTLFVMTSFDGRANVSAGRGVGAVVMGEGATWDHWPLGGAWMEAVVKADDGTWYGYYHNEVAPSACARPAGKVQPQIGAARSTDQGRTWTNLGIILAAPAAVDCDTTNQYFTGGVGDFSVMLSPDRAQLYVLYSQYAPSLGSQGVAVARMAWADRDAPEGKLDVWNGGGWSPVQAVRDDDGELVRWEWPVGQPIFPTTDSWHDGDTANAFWGPSVHWNEHVGAYVMLLNRASTPAFGQEGIYVAFSPDLSNPARWTRPAKVLDGGQWYPQIVGLEPGTGTDKEGGETVRLFVSGVSEYLMTFED